MSKQLYRLVSDYGFGDKTWLERGLTAEEAINAFNAALGGNIVTKLVTTIDEALDYDHPIYSIEEDDPDDEEDWDPMSS